MRALIVVPFPLLVEGGAASRCAVGLVRGLLARDIDCRVLSPDGRAKRDPGPPEDLPVEVVPVEILNGAPARLERWLRPQSLLRRDPFASRLRNAAADVDVVHFFDPVAAAAKPLIDRPAITQIDCLTRLDRDLRGPWRADGRDAIELLRIERRARAGADWLLASSEEVAGGLRALAPHAHVVFAPLALDPEHYVPPAALERPTVGLIGSALWPPTADAVDRLLRSVWPRVIAERPDARLLLAGRGMTAARFAHLPAPDGVEWRGAVPTATGFIRELGALLYPVTRGSGVKVKVLEALAMGVPVVTTPRGAEGLVATSGVTVETDDDRLAAASVALCADVELRRERGAAGRRTFLEHHSPAVVADRVISVYEQAIGTGAARALAPMR